MIYKLLTLCLLMFLATSCSSTRGDAGVGSNGNQQDQSNTGSGGTKTSADVEERDLGETGLILINHKSRKAYLFPYKLNLVLRPQQLTANMASLPDGKNIKEKCTKLYDQYFKAFETEDDPATHFKLDRLAGNFSVEWDLSITSDQIASEVPNGYEVIAVDENIKSKQETLDNFSLVSFYKMELASTSNSFRSAGTISLSLAEMCDIANDRINVTYYFDQKPKLLLAISGKVSLVEAH